MAENKNALVNETANENGNAALTERLDNVAERMAEAEKATAAVAEEQKQRQAEQEQSTEQLQKAEEELVAHTPKDGMEAIKLLQEADRKMKEILNWVFGYGNNFDAILGGVNLLAVAKNGERVVTNLFAALEPGLLEGAKKCAREKAAAMKAGQ